MRFNCCVREQSPRHKEPSSSSHVLTCKKQSSYRPRKFDLRGAGAYFAADIRDDWLLEIQLLVLAFITGIQDSAAYPDYRCFTSNQTGNTVLLAVGYANLLSPENYLTRNSWISLGFFMLGAFALGQIANWIGPRRRMTCFLLSLIQTVLVVGATVIDYSDAAEKGLTSGSLNYDFNWQNDGGGRPYSTAKLVGLGLLAFSNGAQVAMVRGLRVNEITAAKITSTYVDLFMDPYLISLKNRARDRRVLVLIALFGGSFAGAYATVAYGFYFPFLISAIGKALVTFAFMFNRPTRPKTVCPDDNGEGQV